MSSIIARDFYGDDHPLDRSERALLRLDELERMTAPIEVLDNRYWRRDVDAIGPAPGDVLASRLAVDGVRAFWPLSARDSSNVYDLAGAGMTLTALAFPTFGVDDPGLFTYASFASGSSQFLSHTDAVTFDVTGALTLGLWVRFTTVPASIFGLMSKWGTAGQRSYRLYKNASNVLVFEVSGDGSAVTAVTHTRTVVAGTWYFVECRFTPSTELAIWVGSTGGFLEKVVNTTSIPAAIANSTAVFDLARSTAANYHNGDLAFPFLAGAASLDGAVEGRFYPYRQVIGV